MTGTGRSPGSRIVAVARLPKPGLEAFAQWHIGQRLTADSCGGSFGMAEKDACAERSTSSLYGGTEFPISQLALAPVPLFQSSGEGLPCQCRNV
jgi:hypothetical protein